MGILVVVVVVVRARGRRCHRRTRRHSLIAPGGPSSLEGLEVDGARDWSGAIGRNEWGRRSLAARGQTCVRWSSKEEAIVMTITPEAPHLASKQDTKANQSAAKAYAKAQRPWLARHKFLAALVVAVVVAAVSTRGGGNTITGQRSAVSGGSTTDTSVGQISDAAVGQALHVTGNGGLDATVVLESVTTARVGPGSIAEAPKNGNYVVGKFVITDNSGSYAFNVLYLKFQTSDGSTFTELDGNAVTAGFEPSLSAGSLNPGQKTGGVVAFDVPATHGLIQLTDPLGGVVGQWTV